VKCSVLSPAGIGEAVGDGLAGGVELGGCVEAADNESDGLDLDLGPVVLGREEELRLGVGRSDGGADDETAPDSAGCDTGGDGDSATVGAADGSNGDADVDRPAGGPACDFEEQPASITAAARTKSSRFMLAS
jgi:hypothetical protein